MSERYCVGYADCTAEQRARGCSECIRVDAVPPHVEKYRALSRRYRLYARICTAIAVGCFCMVALITLLQFLCHCR